MYQGLWLIILFSCGPVNAANETLEEYWHPEPLVRGTWSLLWSCSLTISICTWSALHLSVPKRTESWYLKMRKFGWFVVAMVAPEYFWMEATDDNMLAEAYVYYLKSLQKDAWTTSHLRFSLARGFKERTSQSAIRTDKLVSLIADNHIDEPPMSKNELKDRGKADLIAVILAILQLLWFGIQELGRYLNSLIITPLEILTVAFTFSAIYIYIVCWEKPQDVNYPIILDLDPSVQVDEDTLRKVKTSVKEHKYKRLMFLAAAGAFFGGFHCIAWNYPFPTLEERIIWRTCAPLTAVLPILSSLVLMYRSYRNLENGKKIHGALSIPYAIARLAIIGLAFSSIRALPASVFEKVNWTNYIPHLGG